MRIVFLAVVVACHPAARTDGVSPREAIVYLASNVDDAQVYIDGQLIGTVGSIARGIAVEPGRHQIELRHETHFSRYAEVEMRRSQTIRLQLDMAQILP